MSNITNQNNIDFCTQLSEILLLNTKFDRAVPSQFDVVNASAVNQALNLANSAT